MVAGIAASRPAAPQAPAAATADETRIAGLQQSIRERNAAVADALRGGQLVQDGVLASSGITGPPALVHVDDAALGQVRALSKSASGNYPVAEEFAERLAERLGIGHLVAPTIERDGRVVVAMVDGVQARQAGVGSPDDVEAMLRRYYAAKLPDVSADAVAHQARVDRQLMQVFDHALGIADRHGRNLLADAETGALTLIDHSEMMMGNRAGRPLEPLMMRSFMAGRGAWAPTQRIALDEDVRRLVAERVPQSWLDETLGDLRARADFSPTSAGRLADETQAASIGKRLSHTATTGELRYRFSLPTEFTFETIGNWLDDSPLLRRLVGLLRR